MSGCMLRLKLDVRPLNKYVYQKAVKKTNTSGSNKQHKKIEPSNIKIYCQKGFNKKA